MACELREGECRFVGDFNVDESDSEGGVGKDKVERGFYGDGDKLTGSATTHAHTCRDLNCEDV